MEPLTLPKIHEFLSTVDGWTYEQWMLKAEFEFESFLEAVSFVNDLAEVAEHLAHHPDITILYNKVQLATVTHDAEDQITDQDLELVKAVEQLIE